LNKKII